MANGDTRTWKNAEGNKSFEAEFISRNNKIITVRRKGGQIQTFPIQMLHESDQIFLEVNHPLKPESPEKQEEETGDAFGPLRFGDNRSEVEKKLLASPIVKTKVEETLFGRTGLNGVFETTETIGGLPCFLYFDWNSSGKLREVTLRTKEIGESSYNGKLHSTWEELVSLLNKLYGKPLAAGIYPSKTDLQEGLMMGSHLWRTNDGHSILLGTGQERAGYNVSARFTTERINPIATP